MPCVYLDPREGPVCLPHFVFNEEDLNRRYTLPWRNPNSIFLYLLIIVSVLGKMNEH